MSRNRPARGRMETFLLPARAKRQSRWTPESTTVRVDSAIRIGCFRSLGNLLGNALQVSMTSAPKAVRRLARREPRRRGSFRRFRADSGPGILPEHFAHLFEPYWKADPGGTGLGLFICAEHRPCSWRDVGGEESARGRGASFSFFAIRGVLPSEGLPSAVPLSWREGLRS